MRLQPNFVIRVDNPPRHAFGSEPRRLASLLRDGMTVREYIDAALAINVVEKNARWNLSAWVRKHWIHLELNGVVMRAVSHQEAIAYVAAPLEQILSAYTFGVELEMILPIGVSKQTLAAKIMVQGIPCVAETYNHTTRQHWKIVTDGSLGNYDCGAEVVSPILSGDDGLRQLAKVCAVLTEVGAKITRKCGLHVHVGAEGKTVDWFKRLVVLYASHEDLIDSVLPASRRANQYCTSIRPYVERVRRAGSVDGVVNSMAGRYRKLNLCSYLVHKTVEFRQHSGTVDAEKAVNWVKFCLRMAALAEGGADVPTALSLNDLISVLGGSEADVAYFNRRAARFTNERHVS